MATKVDGLLFDKDGTLFDFHATWGVWAAHIIRELAQGDNDTLNRLATALHFDLESEAFAPTSPVIASTSMEVAECIVRVLPERSG